MKYKVENCWKCGSDVKVIENEHYFVILCLRYECNGGCMINSPYDNDSKDKLIKKWNSIDRNVQLSLF